MKAALLCLFLTACIPKHKLVAMCAAYHTTSKPDAKCGAKLEVTVYEHTPSR